MIEKAVYGRLSSYTGLTDLVGTSPVRVYPLKLPQNPTYPAVTYGRVSTVRPSAMGLDTGDAQSRVQVDSWDSTELGTLNVSEQVRGALQRWTGTAGGVQVTHGHVANQMMVYEEDVEKWRVIQDFILWQKE